MFILEINPLVLPDIGLVFWNTIAFLVLLVVLGKFAWKPMLKAISDRETGIEDACEMDVVETWSDRSQRDSYITLLTPMKRFMNDDAMDSGKRKPIEHNGNPWYVDKDCPANNIFKFNCI